MEHSKLPGWVFCILALFSFFVAVYSVVPGFFHDLVRIIQFSNIAYSIQLLQSYGQYAKPAVFVIIVLINTLAVLPNIFVLAAAGALFGIGEGTLIAWTAETVGVSISFLLMRYLFRNSAKKFIERHGVLHRLDEFSDDNGFRVILLARCIPYVPSGLITALAALSRIGFKEHFFATLIGKLPSTWVEVTIGHDLLSYRSHVLRLTLMTAVSGLVYFLFFHDKHDKL